MKFKVFLLLVVFLVFGFDKSSAAGALTEKQIQKWFQAAYNGWLEAMQNLIPQIDVNIQDRIDGNTALIDAIKNGHEHIVRFLMNVPNLNINIQNNRDETALIVTVMNRKENIVRLLLQSRDININVRDRDRDTALMIAISNGYNTIAKLLLSVSTTNINWHYGEHDDTAFIRAVRCRRKNIIKYLLKIPDIDINAQDYYGQTALMIAVNKANEYLNIIITLLQLPTLNINIQTKKGKTALMLALDNAHNDKLALVKSFYLTAAELIQDKIKELTVKAFEAIRLNNIETLNSVVAQIGIDTVVAADQNTTLVDKAFALNKPEIVLYLLKNAKNPEALLARFPFEHTNPTSDLFKLCMDLAYGTTNAKSTIAQKKQVCSFCHKQDCTERCSKCQEVYYCNAECQKADWLNHKHVCKTS